jgi:predicted nucleic acid-binding protein
MSFILIFVFLNATLLKKSSFFSLETHSSQEYFSAQNALLKKFESAKYKDYLKSHQKQEKVLSALKSSIPSSSFVSHRLKSEIPSLGKWNLTALLHAEGLSLLLLQELTEKLLIELYGKASFWREAEKQIPQLAKALTHSFLGKKETAFSLVDLFPVEESLQEPFYKML